MPKSKRKSVLKRKEERKVLMREVRQSAETERVNIRPEDKGGSDNPIGIHGVLIVSDGGHSPPCLYGALWAICVQKLS